MRIALAVVIAAAFVLAAWWNQPTFANPRHTADVSINPTQTVTMPSFLELHSKAHLENLPIEEIKEPF
jgi:hypothetical protein